MNNLLKGIVLDVSKSMGTLKYLGAGTTKERRGKDNRMVVSERTYNLRSSEHKGNIEIIIKGNTQVKSFEALSCVELVNPIYESTGQRINGQGYAEDLIYVDDIIVVDK